MNSWAGYSFLSKNPYTGGMTNPATYLETVWQGAAGTANPTEKFFEDTLSSFQVAERTTAGYVMADLSPPDKRFNINFGVRVVATDLDIDGAATARLPHLHRDRVLERRERQQHSGDHAPHLYGRAADVQRGVQPHRHAADPHERGPRDVPAGPLLARPRRHLQLHPQCDADKQERRRRRLLLRRGHRPATRISIPTGRTRA